MTSVNETLRSDAVRHSIYLQRYSTNTASKMLKLLAKTDADIVAQLQALDSKIFTSPLTVERLDSLLESIRTINTKVYNKLYDALEAGLKDLALHETAFQANNIQAPVVIASMEVITPPMAQVYAATMARPFSGRLLKEWVSDLDASTFTRLRDAVRMGVLEGQTIAQIVQRVKGTRAMGYKDGILEISRRGAEALVRTAVNHTVNVARDQVYQANSGLIKGIQWVSTLDGRTSSICQSRDGKVFPLASGPRPPAHINCRSSTAPVLKSWADLGIDAKEFPETTRASMNDASMNGQVAASETYQTWLQKQPATFQDDVLGKTKGKLFRDGGMPLDRFVDRNGASLTLDQLRAKDAAAFKAAGV
jgi:SPP1 gp7 family putative phage head morphogenesis protein